MSAALAIYEMFQEVIEEDVELVISKRGKDVAVIIPYHAYEELLDLRSKLSNGEEYADDSTQEEEEEGNATS